MATVGIFEVDIRGREMAKWMDRILPVGPTTNITVQNQSVYSTVSLVPVPLYSFTAKATRAYNLMNYSSAIAPGGANVHVQYYINGVPYGPGSTHNANPWYYGETAVPLNVGDVVALMGWTDNAGVTCQVANQYMEFVPAALQLSYPWLYFYLPK